MLDITIFFFCVFFFGVFFGIWCLPFNILVNFFFLTITILCTSTSGRGHGAKRVKVHDTRAK